MARQADLLEEGLCKPHALVMMNFPTCVAESACHVRVEGAASALVVWQLHMISPALVAEFAVTLQVIMAPVIRVRHAHFTALIYLHILMHTLGQLVGSSVCSKHPLVGKGPVRRCILGDLDQLVLLFFVLPCFHLGTTLEWSCGMCRELIWGFIFISLLGVILLVRHCYVVGSCLLGDRCSLYCMTWVAIIVQAACNLRPSDYGSVIRCGAVDDRRSAVFGVVSGLYYGRLLVLYVQFVPYFL